MLGKTAGGLFWMFRYLERSENTARLIEAGFRIALTRADGDTTEWWQRGCRQRCRPSLLPEAPRRRGGQARSTFPLAGRRTIPLSSGVFRRFRRADEGAAVCAPAHHPRGLKAGEIRHPCIYHILKQRFARPVSARGPPRVPGADPASNRRFAGRHATGHEALCSIGRTISLISCRPCFLCLTFLCPVRTTTQRLLILANVKILPTVPSAPSTYLRDRKQLTPLISTNLQWDARILRSVAGQRAFAGSPKAKTSRIGHRRFP